MKLSKYILTSQKIAGQLIVTYRDGLFYSVINETKELTELQLETLMKALPLEAINIACVSAVGLMVKKDLKTNEKIDLFCAVYMNYVKDAEGNGVKYKVTNKESGQIMTVEVNNDLLNTYFRLVTYPFTKYKSISDYVNRYNDLRAECYGAKKDAPVKSKHPDTYNREYEKKLDGPGITDYWKHLRSLGYKMVRSERDGSPIDWIKLKPNPQPAVDAATKNSST